MKNAIIGSLCLLVLIGIIPVLPDVFLPKRWLDIGPGQERAAVHAVLGVPDADFTDVKGFDGRHNSFGMGASVLLVRYNDLGTKVSSVSIKTEWGNRPSRLGPAIQITTFRGGQMTLAAASEMPAEATSVAQ